MARKGLDSVHTSIADYTCTLVKRAQSLAEKLHQEGYSVVIVGDAQHPEVEKALLERLKELEDAADPPGVVVLDIPLLDAVPEVAARASAVVAIEAPVDARVARLVARGMAEDDMLRRIAVQPTASPAVKTAAPSAIQATVVVAAPSRRLMARRLAEMCPV